MFNYFLPASKVQKDRRILRETDERMAKYSRRGLIFNFLAFLVCIAGGRFISENPILSLTLTTGLLLITILRGYYLFRFDNLYPRAPAKWRNQYFAVTLLGAIWWGVILFSITLKLELRAEAHLIWLYTVIFFSTTANAFAPYHRFLTYYQFFGIVPAAIAAFIVGTIDAYIYGFMLIAFYIMLSHQCRLISANYWERREAVYALSKKALTLEEEKRETKSSFKLNKEFLHFLNKDLKSTLKQLRLVDFTKETNVDPKIHLDLEGLYNNIRDFDGVQSKELSLENKIFNIRHEIQHIVADYIDEAEQNNVQIETALSPSLPMRLKGDAVRLAQIIKTLLLNILKDAEHCIVLLEVEFLREYENAGELYVSVSRGDSSEKKKMFSEKKRKVLQENISLIVAKAFADIMNGSIEIVELDGDEQKIRFNAKIEVANREGQLDFHKNSFEGKNVLLVHSKPRIVDIKRQELDALGFNVFTETQFKRAYQTLLNSYKFQNPIQSVIYYVEPEAKGIKEFSEALKKDDKLKFTQKLVAATRDQQKNLRRNGFNEEEGFYFVDKPTGLFELESAFMDMYRERNPDDEKEDLGVRVILCCEEERLHKDLKVELDKLVCSIELVSEYDALSATITLDNKEIILVDYDSQEDVSVIVDTVRDIECKNKTENYIPIIGISAFKSEMEEDIYELGLDDFVDLAHNSKKSLDATVKYWKSLI